MIEIIDEKPVVHIVIKEIIEFLDEQSTQDLSKQLCLLLEVDDDDENINAWMIWEGLSKKDWMDRLENQPITSFIDCYLDTIRNCFENNNNRQDIIEDALLVRCYQLLLRRATNSIKHEKPQKIQETNDTILIALEQLPRDILIVTRHNYCRKKKENDNYDDYELRCIVLSSLIKIIEQLLEVYLFDRIQLAGIASLLLSSFQPQSNLLGSLLPSLKQKNVLEDCVIPTPSRINCELIYESIELPQLKIWGDRKVDYAVQSCFMLVAQSLNIELKDKESIDIHREICKILGWGTMAKAVRAQYFEREKQTTEEVALTQKPSTLSYPLKFSNIPKKEPLHIIEESRIHATIRFIQFLDSTTTKPEVLSDIIPVCFSLIDSASPNLVTLGAIVLIKFLQIVSPKRLKEFENNIVSIIEIALKTTENTKALTYICLACANVIEVFHHRNKDRRRFTLKFISLLQSKMFRHTEEACLIQGIISGGLIPMLKQQAMIENVEGVEIARAALQVLLPLLRWDLGEVGKQLQIVSLIGLINLMNAAHPIMPHHSAKIICELFACWGHSNRYLNECKGRELELCQTSISLTTHATAIALALCGERAHQTIAKIRSSDVDPCLVKHITEVEEHYRQLLQENKIHDTHYYNAD